MRVIPVLDIKGGMAVRAVAGSRHDYKPLKTAVCRGSDPRDVAAAFREMGFQELYVADLDGIMRQEPDIDLIDDIASDTGLAVMADTGMEAVIPEGRFGFAPIVSSESLKSIDAGNFHDFVFSMDTRDGILMSGMGMSLDAMLDRLMAGDISFGDYLLLDLNVVGMGAGPNLGLCWKVSCTLGRRVILGCGIRGRDDVLEIADFGACGALIGSCVHSGSFAAADVEFFRQRPCGQ